MHAQFEYLFKPNQDLHLFGNHIVINAYGMGSANFPVAKLPGQFRVLVFGDSVLNGGNLTDQAPLATELLREKLAANILQDVVVGNVIAGCWGPENWLSFANLGSQLSNASDHPPIAD